MTLDFRLGEGRDNPNKRCPRCGEDNPFVNLFCLDCGALLETSEPVSFTSMTPPTHSPSTSQARRAKTPSQPDDWSNYWRDVTGRPATPPGMAPATLPTPSAVPAATSPQRHRGKRTPASGVDRPNALLNFTSFICPVMGLVSYLGLAARLPHTAASAGRSAACGLFVTTAVLGGFALKSQMHEALQVPDYPNIPATQARRPIQGSGTYYQDIMARINRAEGKPGEAVLASHRATRRNRPRRGSRVSNCTPARRTSVRHTCTHCTPARRRTKLSARLRSSRTRDSA